MINYRRTLLLGILGAIVILIAIAPEAMAFTDEFFTYWDDMEKLWPKVRERKKRKLEKKYQK